VTDPATGLNFLDEFQKHGGEAEQIAEGNYDVVVDTAKTQSSKDGSKPQVVLTFKIVDHPKFSGRKITNTFTFSSNSEMAKNIFFRQMAALGFAGEFWAANPTNPFPALVAVAPGRRAKIQVKNEEYQGQSRPRIKNVMPGSGGPAGSGLPPVPGGLAPPPPVAIPSVQQMMAPPAPVAPPVAIPAPPVAAPVPVAPPVVAPPAPAPVEVPVVAEVPVVQEQVPAPAPAAPVQEQTAPEPASAVPPAPEVPF
jgi:hypothetical protein